MKIDDFFRENKKAAIAFSGGVDSTYLLYLAVKNACDIHAYFIESAFQPAFEKAAAIEFAKSVSVPLTILKIDVLSFPEIAENTKERCYFCKKTLFTKIKEAAKADGYSLLLDGTNASDDVSDRPGMVAANELFVRSPLRECGITKDEIRRRSKEAGLSTWDKPAYACLATRIPTGTKIEGSLLKKVEEAEAFLMGKGFSDFRVRCLGSAAKLELPEAQFEKALAERKQIIEGLAPYFVEVFLDLKARG